MRLTGYLLLFAAAASLAFEVTLAFGGDGYRMVMIGELWFRIDQGLGTASLNVSQAVIQRYVSPWLWENVVQGALEFPAWPCFAVFGLVLVWISVWRYRRTRIFR